MRRENPRFDILTRARLPRESLIRLVMRDGRLSTDLEGNLPGRGYYVAKDREALKSARGKKVLEKRFKGAFDPSLYDELEGLM